MIKPLVEAALLTTLLQPVCKCFSSNLARKDYDINYSCLQPGILIPGFRVCLKQAAEGISLGRCWPSPSEAD